MNKQETTILIHFLQLFKVDSSGQELFLTPRFPYRITLKPEEQYRYNLPLFILKNYDPSLSFQQNQYLHDKYMHESGNFAWHKLLNPQDIVYSKSTFGPHAGCQHFFSNTHFCCLTCHKLYPCNYCHDEQENHRFKFQILVCQCCKQTHSNLAKKCCNCGAYFGSTSCEKCFIIMSFPEFVKPVFHCDKCNRCVIGYQNQYSHCDNCNTCIKSFLFPTHNCHNLIQQCSLCLNKLKDGNDAVVQLRCGHFLHRNCRLGLISNNQYRCPVCRRYISLELMHRIDQMYLTAYRQETLPEVWEERFLSIQCNECLLKFVAQQHTIGYRCCNPNCLTFNTQITDNYDQSPDSARLLIQNQDELLINNQIEPLYPMFTDISYYMEFFVQRYHAQLNGADFENKFDDFLKQIHLSDQPQNLKLQCLRNLVNFYQDGLSIQQLVDLISLTYNGDQDN